MIQRRGFIAGLAAALAAPAIIRTPGLLMPVKRVLAPDDFDINAMRFRSYETAHSAWFLHKDDFLELHDHSSPIWRILNKEPSDFTTKPLVVNLQISHDSVRRMREIEAEVQANSARIRAAMGIKFT